MFRTTRRTEQAEQNVPDHKQNESVVSDLTDHFSQFCILNSFTNLDLHDQPKLKRLTRDFSNFSEANFLNELSQVDLTEIVCNKADVNKSFSTFHNKLNKLLNKHAPLKPTKYIVTKY